MDKAEYRIKLEQINSLAEAGDFKGAAAVVDTIDWRHVKSVRTLCMVGEIYEANKRYEDSKRVLQYAYKRSSISKTVLYRLAEINIRTGDYDDAKRFYNEFEQLSPHDTSRYILKYKLLRAEGATLDDQIAVLKEYKEREYTERWAYELAKLYMKNGQKQKCIEECDEMILWFAEGKYVTRAKELKMKLRELSDPQKKKYNDRYTAEKKETAEETRQAESVTAEERAPKAADLATDEDEILAAEKKEKKFSAVDIIRKMDAAADETVSSALGEERTGTVAAMAQVAQKAAATQEAVEKAAKMTATSPKAGAEPVEEVARQANETAPKAVDKPVRKPAEEANAVAEEAVEETEAATEEAVEETETAAEEVVEETEAAAEALEDAAPVAEDAAAEITEEAIEKTDTAAPEIAAAVQAIEEPAVQTEETAREAFAAAAEKSARQANEIAAQASADLAEAEAWKAAAIEKSAAETVRKSAAMKAAEEKAAEATAAARAKAAELTEQFKEQASAEAAEEAAWRAATAAEATAETAQKAAEVEAEVAETVRSAEESAQEASAIEEITETAAGKAAAASYGAAELAKEFAEQASNEAAEAAAWKAVANAAGKPAHRTAIEETEGAAMAVAEEEAAWIEAVRKAAESISGSADISDKEVAEESAAVAASADVATAEAQESAAEGFKAAAATIAAAEAADTTDDIAEKSAPISPEELARSADEEAERALQEMMASFLSEFALSGDKYKKTTDIIPDEEDVSEEAPAPKPKYDRNDPERMLGKETDESLGLTRTESFQVQLKKALEEGGNYEEASQIVIPEDLESPEEAAKRTVMSAHGLEYDPNGTAKEGEQAGEAGSEEGEATADTEGADANVTETTGKGSDNAETAGESGAETTGEGSDNAETAGESGAETTGEGSDIDETAGESGAEASGEDSDNAETAGESDVEASGEGSEDVETSGEGSEDAETTGEAAAEAAGDGSGVTGESGEGSFAGEEGQESGEAAEETGEAPEPEPVKPEPEIMERVAVMPRKFTEEERELFSYFAEIPGISEQASLALADIHNNAGDKTSRSGNVLIMGRQLSGKTRLADALICAACMDLNIGAAKVAKVIGEDLNDKDPAEVVDRMSGGFLLIEGAGSMSDDFVEGLNTAMEFRTDDLVVILEDEKADLMKMLGKHVEFAKKFTSRVIIPVFTNDELVTFARTYANEKGYKLDEMGTLALYTMIGENQTDTEPVVIGQVKKMVDKAIERSKGPKIASLFRKSKNSPTGDGRIWLKEKDFRF